MHDAFSLVLSLRVIGLTGLQKVNSYPAQPTAHTHNAYKPPQHPAEARDPLVVDKPGVGFPYDLEVAHAICTELQKGNVPPPSTSAA